MLRSYFLAFILIFSLIPKLVGDCTVGCAMGNATTDGRPFSWKNRDGSGRHYIWYVTSGGTYNYIAMGNHQGLKMGVNEAGLSLQNSLITDIPSPGYTYENNTSFKAYCLSEGGNVAEIRQAIIEDTSGIANYWPPPSICVNFSDARGYATTFELGAEIYYEYDPTNPNRLAQFPKQFVARANESHKNSDHTDDETTGGIRYITARDTMQYWADNGGLNVTNWINHISRNGEPGVDSAKLPSNSSTNGVMLVHGVNEDEDPRIVTAWIGLGNPDYTCIIPTWVAQQDNLSPWVTSTDQYNSIAGLSEQLYWKKDYNQYDQYINSLMRPVEDNIIEAVDRARTRWFSSGFNLDEATRIHMEACDTAWNTMNSMNAGSERNLNVTPSLTSINTYVDGLLVFFSCIASDNDGIIVAYDWDFGDGNSSTSPSPDHTYDSSGLYLVRCRVVDNNGSRNSKWKYVTVGEGNQAPIVDAGSDQTITLPEDRVFLDATAIDDGQPVPPGNVTATWSQVSGPGLVIFNDAFVVVTWVTCPEAGTYVLRLECDDGELTASDEITIVVNEGGSEVITLEIQVAAGADDAEERSSGSMYLNSSDLELVYDDYENAGDQTVGVRFNGVDIPPGATIIEAYIQFQVDETNSGATSLTIEGEDRDDPAGFSTSDGNISSRPRTAASVSWAPVPWTSVGAAGPDQRTPDIAAVIQEIVEQPGWSSGNSLVIIITGTGERTAESHKGNSNAAPLLHVEYTTGPPMNQAPVVDAGPDQTVTLPSSAILDATVTDDGLPNPPGAVTCTWSKASGPGTVSFGDASAVDTTASFSETGTYLLKLTADDSDLSTFDELSVTVNPEGTQVNTIEIRVETGSDDAEERNDGSMDLNSNDLELVDDGRRRPGQTVGMRFNGATIPRGATITNAYIQFQVDETNSGATSLTIQGQGIGNAPTFTSSTGNISSRARTASFVSWAPVPWTSVGAAGPDQRTPDIAAVIQEIVEQPGWSSGNSLVIIITGTGERTAESHKGNSNAAPLLHVEYLTGPPNQPPTATMEAR